MCPSSTVFEHLVSVIRCHAFGGARGERGGGATRPHACVCTRRCRSGGASDGTEIIMAGWLGRDGALSDAMRSAPLPLPCRSCMQDNVAPSRDCELRHDERIMIKAGTSNRWYY